jgi:hypothetical protein
MGVNWAATLLGIVGLVLMPSPFLFYKYGAQIRSHSKFAPCAVSGKNIRDRSVILSHIEAGPPYCEGTCGQQGTKSRGLDAIKLRDSRGGSL